MVAGGPPRPGATVWEGAEAVEPVVEGGLVRGAVVTPRPRHGRRRPRRDPGPLHGRRRRGQLPLRPVPRHQPRPELPARDGHPRLLDLAPPRRAVDRQLARHPRQGGQRPARLRVDLPGRRRPGQRRDRPALHVQPVEGRQHHAPAAELRRLRPGVVGHPPRDRCGPATGGRLPMGMSVGPHAGPTWLVVGDAGGAINPFNGEGIAYAYESGRFAADAVHLALTSGDGMALQAYQQRLEAAYALYYKVARAFVRIIGRPELMRVLVDDRDAQPHPDGVGAADHGQPAPPRRARARPKPPTGPWPPWPAWFPKRRSSTSRAGPASRARTPADPFSASGGEGLQRFAPVRRRCGPGSGKRPRRRPGAIATPRSSRPCIRPDSAGGGRPGAPVVVGHGLSREEHAHQRPDHRHLHPGAEQAAARPAPSGRPRSQLR